MLMEVSSRTKELSMRVFITRLIWLCVFPTLLLASWIAIDNVRSERAEFLAAATRINNNLAMSIDRSLQTYINGLQMLSQSSLADDPRRWSDLYREAQGFQRSFGAHVIFAQATGERQMLFNTRRPYGSALPVLPKPSGRAAASIALATGRAAVGDSFIGPVADQPLVAAAVPVRQGGQASYLMLATIETAHFQKLLEQTEVPAGWSIKLVDSVGKTIASRSTDDPNRQQDFDADGRIAVAVGLAPWSLIVDIPRPALQKPMYSAIARYLAVLLLALASSVVVGKVAARRLVRGVDGLLDSGKPSAYDSGIAEINRLRRQIDLAIAQRDEDSRTLVASEERFTATFEQAAVGIALVAPDGHWLRVNRKLAQIVGYAPQELMARTFQDITHADDLDRDLELVRRMLAREIDSYSIEKRYLRSDGSQVWVNLTVALIWTAYGDPDYFVSVIEDIDARKRAQDEMLATKGKFEAALASMTDAVVIVDPQGNFIEFNDAYASFLRFSSKDECARTLAEYQDFLEVCTARGESLSLELWPVSRALRGETASNAEYVLRRTDSGEVWTGSLGFGPIRSPDGEIVGAVVTARDITERKASEISLRENASRLRLALDAAKAGTWEWDLKTHCNIWSDEVYRLYGLQPASCEPSFATWLGTIHPRDREAAALAASEAERQAAELNVEWQVNDPSGQVRWLMSRGQPQFDADGQAVRYLGIVMDVTERKLAGIELEQHRFHLEQLVEQRTAELADTYRSLSVQTEEIRELYNQAPCGYHSQAPDGVVLAVNDTELELLGYRRDEFVGRSISDFMTAASVEAFRRNFSEFARVGRMRDLELDFVRKDGSIVPVLVSGDLVRDASGRFLHTRSIVIDNSERKARAQQLSRLQAELARRADEAEAATRAKSAFLANMSHEIRTPMNAILGLTHLVLRAGQSPEQAERMHKIESAGRHLLSVINDILDLSKIEAGRVDLESTDFHLDAILDNIVSMISDQAASKGLAVGVDPDSVPVWLRGDPTRLRQALLNYAVNAVKFTHRGTITIRAILLEDAQDTLLVRFEVEDSGIGIPVDVLPGLFRSFEQADASTTRQYGGTGLGLAITRHLAGLMGGDAGAVSTPGVGSTFWLTARLGRGHGVVPLAPREQSADAEAVLQSRHAGARVLLAEDNEINREVALELLHSVALSADTACTGREAVAMAQSHGYDLILMDMQMPEMDGTEAARLIRALPGWQDKPIIAMTANAFADDKRQCEAAGMNDFIAKPVDPEAFFATLLKWLSGRVVAGQSAVPDGPVAAHVPLLPAAPADDGRTDDDVVPDLPGIDTAVGLRYLLGKKTHYLRLLRSFRDSHGRHFIADFRAARASGDQVGSERLAHTLKGLAGSIGAQQLGALAARLEAAVQAGDAALLQSAEGDVGNEITRLMSGLNALGEAAGYAEQLAPETSSGARADPEQTQQMLGRFRELLETHDAAAVSMLGEFCAVMRRSGRTPGDLAEIEAAVKRFDYAHALRLLILAAGNKGNTGEGAP